MVYIYMVYQTQIFNATRGWRGRLGMAALKGDTSARRRDKVAVAFLVPVSGTPLPLLFIPHAPYVCDHV